MMDFVKKYSSEIAFHLLPIDRLETFFAYQEASVFKDLLFAKQAIEKIMSARGVKGARIYVGGRLAGAEISRSEQIKRGSIPLQTFRADVDFAREKAHMSYGDIGIKVWIYRGEVFESDKGVNQNKNDKIS
jgi:ribosomal protein S3